jgi:hypothetical protein
MGDEKNIEEGLGIPDTEMFDLFQKQRPHVLAWLAKDPFEANRVMESIVRVVTMVHASFFLISLRPTVYALIQFAAIQCTYRPD